MHVKIFYDRLKKTEDFCVFFMQKKNTEEINLGNINIENIWERGFTDQDMLRVESECRKTTSEKTDELIMELFQISLH